MVVSSQFHRDVCSAKAQLGPANGCFAHELSHILGYKHEAGGVMAETLAQGERPMPGFTWGEATNDVALCAALEDSSAIWEATL